MHKTGTRHHRANYSDFDLNGDFEKIRDAILATTQDMKGRTGELLSQSLDGIKQKSQEMQDNLADYTASKPLKTLGIAFLGGIVLGFLLRKRR